MKSTKTWAQLWNSHVHTFLFTLNKSGSDSRADTPVSNWATWRWDSLSNLLSRYCTRNRLHWALMRKRYCFHISLSKRPNVLSRFGIFHTYWAWFTKRIPSTQHTAGFGSTRWGHTISYLNCTSAVQRSTHQPIAATIRLVEVRVSWYRFTAFRCGLLVPLSGAFWLEWTAGYNDIFSFDARKAEYRCSFEFEFLVVAHC